MRSRCCDTRAREVEQSADETSHPFASVTDDARIVLGFFERSLPRSNHVSTRLDYVQGCTELVRQPRSELANGSQAIGMTQLVHSGDASRRLLCYARCCRREL